MLTAGVRNVKLLVYVLAATVVGISVLWMSKPDLPGRAVHHIKGTLLGGSAPESIHEESWWFEDKWPFQADVLDQYDLPGFNTSKLKNYPPHNYKGRGRPTFATFYASHDATNRDPYFIATLQVIYRLLWDPKTRSDQYPVTVFVPDFVRQDHCDYFTAAGAIVRTVDLIEFQAEGTKGVSARFKDQFSKLELWRQTDYSRIAFMDCDAFALRPCDDMFDPSVSPEQTCRSELLDPADQPYAADMCDYVFSAHEAAPDGINGGVLILKPDQHMYERLRREMRNTTGWNTYNMEQAFLSYAFDREQSPFPVHGIDRKWNAFDRDFEEGVDVHILHDKMWAHYFENNTWQDKNYKDVWASMLHLYNSTAFVELREKDKEAALANMKAYRPEQDWEHLVQKPGPLSEGADLEISPDQPVEHEEEQAYDQAGQASGQRGGESSEQSSDDMSDFSMADT